MKPVRSIKFLLVDDLEANLLALEGLLKRDGLELLKARSGSEALELLLLHDISLAFLDVQMPEMGGFELAEIMRSTDRTRGVPIIFLTAGAVDQERRLRAYSTGAVDFLHKPIEPDTLLTKAATFFELARQREELRDSEVRLRELNAELAERNRELAQADRNKDQFLAVLAHELRNPLAPILMGLDMLEARHGSASSENAELAAMMRRQMGQMTHLIDDLLDLSRVNTGKIILRRERTELTPVIEQAIEAARPLIDARHHELSVELPTAGLIVEADRHRLAQIISNLLSNAAKYTPAGGWIRLSVRVEEGRVARIVVSDNGEGISPEDQARIFAMFEQINGERQDGLGIGLTLVKNLVELHGGAIAVASEGLGKGSEFSVTLDLVEIFGESGEEEEVRSGAGTDAPQAQSDRPAKVIVADDGRSTADVLGMFIEMEGIECRVVYNGEQAVEAEDDFRPQMVFMDLGMPKLNGYEAARKIRESGREVVLVALSGWGREEDLQRSKEAGFDEHLVKPVTPDQLRSTLARYPELLASPHHLSAVPG